jgi:hypothetical protein
MRGLALRNRWGPGLGNPCPTLSHVPAAGGQRKSPVDWALVSPVSLVSLIFEINKRLKTNEEGGGEKEPYRSRKLEPPAPGTRGTSAITARL